MRRTRYAACLLGATLAFAGCAGRGAEPSAAPTRGGGSTSAPPATSASPTSTTTRPPTKATSKPTAARGHTAVAPRTQAPGEDRLVPVPARGPQPTVRFPDNEAAVGRGANAVTSPVPDVLWARMVGYSWTRGCPVGRSELRQVRVNFWGFDGKRSRGLCLPAHLGAAGRHALGAPGRSDVDQLRPVWPALGRVGRV